MNLTDRTVVSDFQIFTGAMTAAVDGDRKIITCTASSSVVDLHGDEIVAECIQDMASQALAKGMTIFLNHSYDIPEDTFGRTVAASSAQKARDTDGNPIWEMDLAVEVDESNPRAIQTYNSLTGDPSKGRKGLRLGVSIGAQISDWEYRDTKKGFDGGIRIKGVDLLEASVVGIPANPRSWVQNGVMSLRKRIKIADSAIEEQPLFRGLVLEGIEVTAGETAELVVPEITDAAPENCPACGHGKEGDANCACDAPFHNGAADVEAADVIAEVEPELTAEVVLDSQPEAETPGDNDDSLPSAPADGDSREEADVAVADPDIESVVKSVSDITISQADRPVLEMVLSTLELTAKELKETRLQVASLKSELEAVTADRDKAVEDTADAARIIETIAKLPLGRKTRFVAPVQTFRQRFSNTYDEDFLRLIDERNSDG
jgi:hypothetical protein